MPCARCGKKKSPLNVRLEGNSETVCYDCYVRLEEEYRNTRNCEDCAYWDGNLCKKTNSRLEPSLVIGIKDFYTQAKNCVNYLTTQEYEEKVASGELIEEKATNETQLVNARALTIDKKAREILEKLFGDQPIKVRGQIGKTEMTVAEFSLYLKGYLAFGAKELILYRFHHGTGESESLSYAFLIDAEGLGSPIFDSSYWVVFPNFAPMESGTGHASYDQVEKLIKDAQAKIVDKEISSEDFLQFLKAKEKSWL